MTETIENVSATVYVVDDDPSIRQSISRLLAARGYRTAPYACASAFLQAAPRDTPSCLILDLCMPELDGLELQEALAQREWALPIVFLSGRGDIAMSVRAMKAGAVDFLTKPVRAPELFEAVASALARDRDRAMAQARERVLRERFERLTGREREVFFQVTDGRLNKQIATELGISERTIKAHRAQVMDKMSVRTFAELVRAADRIRSTSAP